MQPEALVPDHKINHITDHYRYSKKTGFVARKLHNVRGLTITNVATPPLPRTVPSLPDHKSGPRDWSHAHVAWTSVRQERWEGELAVEGEIPLWLVCVIS